MRLLDAAEDRGDHLAARSAPFAALEAAQVGEQAGTARAVRAHGLVLVDEGDQLGAGDAVRRRGPVAPAVGRLDRGPVAACRACSASASSICSMSSRNFRNMIQVSIGRRSRSPLKPLVLAHDVARGLDQAAELLGGRERLGVRSSCASSPWCLALRQRRAGSAVRSTACLKLRSTPPKRSAISITLP